MYSANILVQLQSAYIVVQVIVGIAMVLLVGVPGCLAGSDQMTLIPDPVRCQPLVQVHPAVERRQEITNNHLSYRFEDELGAKVAPIAVAQVDEDVYFLGSDCLWLSEGAKPIAGAEDVLVLKRLDPPCFPVLKAPWQEFNDFVYWPARKVLVVLDKSGDLFEYLPKSQSWAVLRKNVSAAGSPDPDYIALCVRDNEIALLDPERNQIWHMDGPHERLGTSFKEILPWRLKPGEPNVSDGIACGFAKVTYVLKRNGDITTYDGYQPGAVYQHVLSYRHPDLLRPTRLTVGRRPYLFVVEHPNNRVIKIDTLNGNTASYVFAQDADLRGMVVCNDGFWIISGEHFIYKDNKSISSLTAKISPHLLDSRLTGLMLPIAGQRLPRHPGVFPGARRLYRYGVHAGLDMFNTPGWGSTIAVGTAVVAAKSGRIVRADANFKDMDAGTFNKVMNECRKQHFTSARNEDLFRGCQVWIDHGNNLVTRYAHLCKIKPGLAINTFVSKGDLLGFVGVSGTGENLPGRVPHPHLHFEIWLDGKYLGYGLTPPETMAMYDEIFAGKRIGSK